METTPIVQDRPAVIQARNLTKRFGDEAVIKNINLDVPQGSIFGFIGASGAGKTTTVRLLTGIFEPSEGEVSVFGLHPAKFRRRDREKIGYLPQLFILYRDLTVWENMNFAASLYGVGFGRNKRMNWLLDFVELSEAKHKRVREISGGMQRRLSLAATLIHEPNLLFLDEPTAGIDPILRRKFWDYFKELQTDQRTFFITTQYVGEAAYCDLIGVMAGGQVVTVSTPLGIRREAYGGDIVSLRTAEPLDYETRLRVQNMPFVKGPIYNVSDREVQIIVDEASTVIPDLIEHFRERGIAIESIENYLPPFEDVFVKLIEKHNSHD